ncbi:hypothetical protein GWK47_018223 [Chionoecetes opilio]|uniref:Uncharacterized protein n=1 Tax=Chionoecetes opilio TaxID=41210 RepID=A0A8J4XRX1_CHIOP|nr:hypothetical protein GWK47_018223 [Chionoecetes opilio]
MAVIFAESLEFLVMALEALHEEAKPLGLEVSWLKTKVQVFGELLDEAVQSVHACGEDIEILESFTYLGSAVHNDGGSRQEVLRQIGIAHGAMDSLSGSIWRCRYLCRRTKIRIFKSLVIPVLLYGCETWTLNSDLKRRINAFGNKCLRRIMGYRWDDYVSNQQLHRETDSRPITCIVRQRQLQVLQTVISWGRRWQVDLAPEKTQAMLISRRQRPLDTPIPTILLGGRPVPLQTSISILGVEVNSVLTFTDHIRTIARKAAWKLSCVVRVSHLLDSQGITTLYAAQVRSLMEYAPLTWSSCPPSYLSLLDKVQARAQRLIRLKALQDQLLPPLQPLQQRRDVAGLCIVYKTHKQHVPHLAALRQPWARPHGHTTRTAATRDHQLIVPFARTETSLRSFLPRYTRMWNRMVQQTQLHSTSSLQTFKSAVNAWIKQP